MIPKRELKRKAIHLLFGIVFIALLYFLGTITTAYILGICLILGVLFSLLISSGMKIPFLRSMVLHVERENEKKFPGKAAIFFFISALLVVIVFKDSLNIALAAIMVQVFADAAAALVGMSIGKHRIYRKKTFEGTVACFIVAAICIAIFFPQKIALSAALIATIVELLPIDDNLGIPIITAISIQAMLIPFTL